MVAIDLCDYLPRLLAREQALGQQEEQLRWPSLSFTLPSGGTHIGTFSCDMERDSSLPGCLDLSVVGQFAHTLAVTSASYAMYMYTPLLSL